MTFEVQDSPQGISFVMHFSVLAISSKEVKVVPSVVHMFGLNTQILR